MRGGVMQQINSGGRFVERRGRSVEASFVLGHGNSRLIWGEQQVGSTPHLVWKKTQAIDRG